LFKLEKLVLHNIDDSKTYTYEFCAGINYFVGKNDSGKTEFYTFIDYMLGANFHLYNRVWFKDSLLFAELYLNCDGIRFVLTRYLNDKNKNFFNYLDEERGESIRLEEYKARINRLLAQDDNCLRELRSFVDEDLSFRTFTLFNFLGEGRQGILNDFFDKCSDVRYSIKLPAVLNYIFNKNLAEIEKLKEEEARLASLLERLEKRIAQNEEVKNRVNRQLEVLGIDRVFSGTNTADIQAAIEEFQSLLQKKDVSKKTRTIAELEAVYTSLDEQIKIQLTTEADCKSFKASAQKQKDLLENLQVLIETKPEYAYLVTPIIQLTTELDQSISFSKYLLQESTTKELKKRRDQIRNQIIAEQSRYKVYSVPEKIKAITLVKEYLGFYDTEFSAADVKGIRSKLRETREIIRHLQNSNDTEKIEALSDDITTLYKQSKDVSDLVEYDFANQGFRIAYIKNGNTLQPQVSDEDVESGTSKNYYTGSMARHTLIQLCGYLAFLRMLINEKKYPLAPILVIDHISKPFDSKNEKAIGQVLNGAFSDIHADDLQVFMFDDKEPSNLAITANSTTNLVDKTKSGFNPFYHIPEEKGPNGLAIED